MEVLPPRTQNAPIRSRNAAIEIQPEEFRALGYQLIDHIADFMAALPEAVEIEAESLPESSRGRLDRLPRWPSWPVRSDPSRQCRTAP